MTIDLHEFPRPTRWQLARFYLKFWLALAACVFALIAIVLLTGCATPKAGTPCPTADAAYCLDGGVARSCQGGVLVDYPCTGPQKCQVMPSKAVMCDQSSGAFAGGSCLPPYMGLGQCAADGGYLVCTNGKWVHLACAQGTKCHDDGGVSCL